MRRVVAIRSVLGALACVGLLTPGTAAAGTASAGGGSGLSDVTYLAGAGETNRLVVSFSGFVIQDPGGSHSGPGTVTFTDPAGVRAGAGCAQAGANSARCNVNGPGLPSTLYTVARLGDGNDSAVATGGISVQPVKFFGGPGNDYLRGGGGLDELSGDAGSDLLQGGDGATTKMLAGSAADGADTFVGGGGFDTVTYRERTAPLTLRMGAAGKSGEAGEGDTIGPKINRVVGGRGDDRMTGDKGINDLFGGPGKDVIAGEGGDDTLQSGRGNTADVLRGGGGDDDLKGNAGPNLIVGGSGRDKFDGRAGKDRLRARDGSADAVLCGKGSDTAGIDGHDFIAKGCEHHKQRTHVGAVLLQTRSFLDDDFDAAAFRVGCPADGPARCTGTFDVFRDGKRRSRDSFSIGRGRIDSVVTKPGEGAKVLGDVRLKLVSNDELGQIQITRVRGHIDPALGP